MPESTSTLHKPTVPVRDANLANAIRALAMDAVEAAKSGHPGMPMGMAEIAVALWTRHLRHDPGNPHWPNRDRFVLSNGHGSMLQYALLHLCGYDLPLDELRRFRQLQSKRPGHPEVGVTPGVETTTGPLGQGLANGVGVALAERLLAAAFNRPGHSIVDHPTYVFVGDGCLMEGISHEACSLAGKLRLGKLIVLYDDNGISIDGATAGWFTDDTPRRFEAYGWQVVPQVDGHDIEAVSAAIVAANAERDRPTLICCKTIIGRGAPTKAGTAEAHGAALGEREVAAARVTLDWPYAPFVIPGAIHDAWNAKERGARDERDWSAQFARYAAAHPDPAAEFQRRNAGHLPETFAAIAETFIRAYVGTFLTFSDYMRNAVRMAALMKLRSIFVFTHDSIGLGEDGPTHQSIEHAASLRLIPQLDVWRPCDTVETAVAWRSALTRRDGPTALLVTRQTVAFAKRSDTATGEIDRGGYVLADFATEAPERRAVVIATGSEVPVALGARDALAKDGIGVRVASMPCTQQFDRQDDGYRLSVLPRGIPRLAVEAGVTDGWRKYVGAADDAHAGVVDIDRFGESAPAGVLFRHFGFTVEHVVDAARRIVE